MNLLIMQELSGIFSVAILIMSVVVHEVAHGFVAYRFGDRTALFAGRLTLNPLRHLDLFGSVLIPLFMVLSGVPFLIGWAKPVPYNPANFKNIRKGTFMVSIAGIVTNLIIAIAFGLAVRLSIFFGLANEAFITILSIIVFINLGLALFNAIPIPPLDGSKVLFSILGKRFSHIEIFLEKYSTVLIVVFIFLIWNTNFLSVIIQSLFTVITGMKLF